MDIKCDIKTEAKSSPEANDVSETPLRLVVSPQASSKHSNEDESQPSGTQPSPSSSSSPSNSALDSFIQIFQQQMSGSAKTSPSAEHDLASKHQPPPQPQASDPRDMLFRLGQQLMLLASNPPERSTVSPEVSGPNNLKGLSMRGNQKYSAFYQQKKLGMPFNGSYISNPLRSNAVNNQSPVLKKLPQKRPLEDHPDFNKLNTVQTKPKETAFLCSCNEEFENLYIFTIHMKVSDTNNPAIDL
ncbi:hypothetical protein Ciccas_004332 [Cichlidogyrus casuarinus]|uniref:Uncharacterized protein n=1 Tax=Cichlidogyrus casuarinus TaxID=1844966 RepID=A0ABD2QF93_9PLAT